MDAYVCKVRRGAAGDAPRDVVGKGSVHAGLHGLLEGLETSVSVTTREPRPGERDGVAYHVRAMWRCGTRWCTHTARAGTRAGRKL